MTECHYFLLVTILIIFIPKTDIVVINTYDTMCSYGHFMGISSQVFHYLCRAAKGCFGIYIPFLFAYGGNYIF